MSCTPDECLKCAISLLGDSAYQWWNSLVSVVPRERGRMMVMNYEREFVRLSKYARECVSTESIMCKRFEDGLNEDIRACKAKELAKEKRKAKIESRDSRKRQMGKSF
ncbi:Retrotransposon gag domain-containing 1 [Gossypium australe]|uniref:Retrotransposon gag domain-containing 1 n=1 Tax=Gossypium australe TaxID=47621 RepID=A0A5B6VVS5_9ROSI|nr:Retrotransposon gag domain-containing 1 [Gossypium australe]